MKRSTLFFLLVTTGLGISTYLVKQSVISIEQNLTINQKKIFQLEEALHILKAEWNHLNQPDRLQKLVENYLSYKPITGTHLASMNQVPLKDESLDKHSVTLASAEYTQGLSGIRGGARGTSPMSVHKVHDRGRVPKGNDPET